jgi:propionate CoA-transferase
MTTEDLVEVVQLAGREWLFYKAICPTVTFIRGTYADEWGNISIDKEPVHTEALSAAQAAHNAGGLVLAQVEKIVPAGSIHPKKVRIPGIIVDYVVVDPHQWQTRLAKFDPTLTGDERKEFTALEPMPLDERKVIARRAAQEVKAGDVVNLGIGMPEGVAAVAAEEGRIEDFTLTVESGPVGGMPMSDAQFGASLNPVAIVDQPAQFDFYDGGGLNITCLGMGQMDEEGNVNVSRFGKVLAGCGGFINISQNARRVVFCGSFTGSGLEVKVGGGKIEIVKEGRTKKLLKAVEQITFSGNYARSIHQHVLYVTERAVFELLSAGLTLIELAPGINLEKDILANMDFVPLISSNVREMDQKFFE